jgi:hypothetical protein
MKSVEPSSGLWVASSLVTGLFVFIDFFPKFALPNAVGTQLGC